MWFALASAALLAGGTPAAHAQSDASTPPSALVQQARTARAQGRLGEAIDAYSRAYLEAGDANLLFELGECQRAAGQPAAAVRSFQNYLRRAPRGSHHRSAEKQVDELQTAASPASSPAGGAASVTSPPPALQAAPLSAGAVRPPVTPPPAAWPAQPSSPPTIDLTAAAAPRAPASPPLPRWVPWSLAAATVVLASAATWAGLSANDRFDELHQSCAQTFGGCDPAATSDLKDRARRANILWALTGVAAMGTGITVYVNTSAAGLSGLWRY
ncbi:MAG TPA: tetratricopeptide repeat protein [Polyangia bacterium]|nr:tetratricopeptide repeat protein [Polyangia bacterium]